MTLRTKTMAVLGTTLVVLIACILQVFSATFLEHVFAMEEQDVRQNVRRATDTLADEVEKLSMTTQDWAVWDDTYQFMGDENEDYRIANLTPASVGRLKLNLLAYVDPTGRLVFGTGFDPAAQQARPIPRGMRDRLAAGDSLLRDPGDTNGRSGVILLDDGPMMVAAWPILTSQSEGPPRGTLVMGRFLDAVATQRLSARLHLPLVIHRFDDPTVPEDIRAAHSAPSAPDLITVHSLSGELNAGYATVRDMDEQPALLLRVEVPRLIYAQGRASIGYLVVALLSVGCAFGVVTWLLLARLVLSPVARLNAGVEAIRASGDRSLRMPVDGRDELASLARAVNGMLEAIETEKQRTDKVLEFVIPIGAALSREHDFNALLERILVETMSLCHADGGTLYLRTEDNRLKFAMLRTESLNVAMGGTTGSDIAHPPLPLYDEATGEPNHHFLATHAVVTGTTLNIPDAYAETSFDVSGTRAFDERTGYRSTSFLVVPLKNGRGHSIGALQLINARAPETGQVVPFDRGLEQLTESLSVLAAGALDAYMRVEHLQQEVRELRIEIDDAKVKRKVTEITESDYFQTLQRRARDLRTRDRAKS